MHINVQYFSGVHIPSFIISLEIRDPEFFFCTDISLVFIFRCTHFYVLITVLIVIIPDGGNISEMV